MPEVILGREMQTNQIIPISDVERRSGGTATGENESPQRWQLSLETVDQVLQARDVLVGERRF